MAITYPLTAPVYTVFAPASISFMARSTVVRATSPFTGTTQVCAYPGEWWEANVTLPPMRRADAEEWLAVLIGLNGSEGTLLLGDSVNATPRGAATGTPLVKGASQTGKTLITDGWTNSVTGILKAGDWIQLGSGSTTRLHKIMKAANSDGSGNATLDIWPQLRSSPADNAAITTSSTLGLWRLASNDQSWDIGQAQFYGLSFALIEAL